ncbi:MAG: PBP1A family penicillin-binding protein [Rickettsiales bacterium]|jgi:penicillin-binding protein 1A|nr:PBP1A family penicillin-binding protein [Rickettsiales bacterium]
MRIKQTFKKIAKWTGLALFWGFVVGIAALAFMVVRFGNDLPDYRGLATYAPPTATRLYAADGTLLIEYAEERRVFIDFADFPPQLVNAFIAAEDKNFWTHPGIDALGIIRAAGNNIISMFGGPARFSGASTITQQVAKNFFLSSDRTISRKIREAILALRLERSFSKEHIMTLYLNEIFLGSRAYGVGSAALMYFDKPVAELSLAQMAFLASLPKAPNARENALPRRNYVLNRMVDEKFITRADANAAIAEPLEISNSFMSQMSPDFGYFAEDVRRQLLESVGREKLYNQGLYVKTTIDPKIQHAVSAALNKALDSYNNVRPNLTEKLQGAAIVINPHNGRVLAMTGGRNFNESSFNRATQALRQVGSTIKPFVYLAALERGDEWTPETLILDAPITGWREGNMMWKPENYDKKFLGPTPLRLCLEQSRNVPAIRLVEAIGVRRAIAAAQKFGVYPDDLRDLNLSMALGSADTTLERLTLGFAAFINGGYKREAHLVDYVQDRYGKIIESGKRKAESGNIEWDDNLQPPVFESAEEPLSDPQSLYQIVSILQGAIEMGTGRQARVPGHIIAGKTGTTNEVRDLWFVGFSRDLVAGVYLGFDTPKPLGPGQGSYIPARVFSEFMTVALSGEKNRPFAVPDGMSFQRVNRDTGVAAAEDPDGTIITEAFKPGQKPNPKPKAAVDNSNSAVVGGVF